MEVNPIKALNYLGKKTLKYYRIIKAFMYSQNRINLLYQKQKEYKW
jgi:hypothetical protein